jgi:hypothetical protein
MTEPRIFLWCSYRIYPQLSHARHNIAADTDPLAPGASSLPHPVAKPEFCELRAMVLPR